MRLVKIIISIALVGLTVFGWMTVGASQLSSDSEYAGIVAHAEKAYEIGLYEDAYNNYTRALEMKRSQELTQKQVDAYLMFYQSEKEGDYASRHKLITVLDLARRRYPDVADYAIKEISLYQEEQDYNSAKRVCQQALEENKDNEELVRLWQEVVSSFELDYEYYSDYRDADGMYYTVTTGVDWNFRSADGKDSVNRNYEKAGAVGKEGIYLAKEPEMSARFYDLDGVARGVTQSEYQDYGVYQEGLCPVQKSENEWTYINLLGEEQLGSFLYAGTFSEGKAAVQDLDGVWHLIDRQGEIISSKNYYDVKLDISGAWQCGGIMIAAQKDNQYMLLNSEEQQIGEFQCANIDIPTADGLFAFEQDGKWGYISDDGNVIITPSFEQARSFRGGLAAVCQNGQWGYIDRKGELVVNYQFFDAGYVTSQGAAMVSDVESFYRTLTFNYFQEVKGRNEAEY